MGRKQQLRSLCLNTTRLPEDKGLDNLNNMIRHTCGSRKFVTDGAIAVPSTVRGTFDSMVKRATLGKTTRCNWSSNDPF